MAYDVAFAACIDIEFWIKKYNLFLFSWKVYNLNNTLINNEIDMT